MLLLRFAALLLAATTASLSLSAQAQIVHANFDTPTFDDGVSMGGPNLLFAIKTQAPTVLAATRVEVWTGEQSGTNTISLWSHDAINNRPLAPLGTGSWSMGRVNGWQGAPLATPVVLNANEDVWVVWGCQNGAQAPADGPGPGAQQYRGSFDGGASWNGPFTGQQWKFRIWTGFAGHYEVYGPGCNGSRGTPQLGWYGMPLAGTSFDVHLDRGAANSFAVLSFGTSNTNENGTPLPYSLAGLGAPNCSVQASLLVTAFAPTNATGHAQMVTSLPNDPTLAGFLFFNQWFCLDTAANALGLSTSNAGAATIGF